MVEQYQRTEVNKPLVDYSFDILNSVSQGSFTKWSIVYDISNKKVYFKTNSNQQKKFFSLSDFNYSCSSQPLTYPINKGDKGDVSKNFTAYSNEENKKMLRQAFRESSSSISIAETLQNAVGEFATEVKCR
jgi:choloylglycine hydrolase